MAAEYRTYDLRDVCGAGAEMERSPLLWFKFLSKDLDTLLPAGDEGVLNVTTGSGLKQSLSGKWAGE